MMQDYPTGTPHGSQEPNNTPLIIAISVLGALLAVIIVVGILFLTGVFSFSDDTAQSSTAAIVTATSEPAPAATTVPPSSEAATQTMYVANVAYSIYFRSQPAEDESNIIDEIPLGTPVGFIDNADAVFAKISYNNTIGYVKREYLSATQPAPAQPAGDTSVKYTVYVSHVDYAIYLRSAPVENSSNIICEIPVGTAVGYIESANSNFSKISYNGAIGYAKSEYLSRNAATNTMQVCNVQYAIYLRSAPTENGNIICEIPVGSLVTYLENANAAFYKISWNGTVGYAKSEYLRWY